jgi:2-dehydropantoate 2-reductase
MKILIYGAGAIGSNLGGLLTQGGQDVTLLARGAQLAALKDQGLVIEREGIPDQHHRVKVISPAEPSGQFDLIFVCLKAMQLENSAADMVSRLTPDGALVMIQNGLPWWYFDGISSEFSGVSIQCLDQKGMLKKYLPIERIIGAVIYMPIVQIAPGRIFWSNAVAPKLVIGEVKHEITPRVRAIESLMSQVGLATVVTDNIRSFKWQKLLVNMVWNSLCAITQSSPGYIAANAYNAELVEQLIQEGLAVAKSVGVDVDVSASKELDRVKNIFNQQPSMLQDVRSGKELECDAIVNCVIEIAQITGIQVPALQFISGLLDVINQAIIREKKGIQFSD